MGQGAALERVMLCLRYGIGDVVMELPIVRGLRAALPEARLCVLGARPAIEVLETGADADAVACVQDWGIAHWGDAGTPTIRAELTDWMAAQRFELVLDSLHAPHAALEAIQQSGVATRQSDSGAQIRALRAGHRAWEAIRQGACAGWGMDIPDTGPPTIHPRPQDQQYAGELLAGSERPLVAISPVASSPLKRWPVDRLAHVAEALAGEEGEIIVFTGPDEARQREVCERLGGRRNVRLVGATHLGRVAAVLSRCDVFIGNDTGLMHLAAAAGVVGVAVFAPTSPGIYCPPGVIPVDATGPACPDRLDDNFGPGACLARGSCRRPEGRCIDSITALAVLHAARAALDGGSAHRAVGNRHQA